MAEINVTPFVDILLVLLIAFMISAPLVTHSLDIDLPEGKTKESASPVPSKPLMVEVDQKQQILMVERRFKFSTLKEFLNNMPSSSKKRAVYIQMDKRVQHGFLIKLMLLFKNSGFKQVGLVFAEE